MEIIAKALNAMYGINLSREDVINIGKKIIKTELEFNKNAGIDNHSNILPLFFHSEELEPINLKDTFKKKIYLISGILFKIK